MTVPKNTDLGAEFCAEVDNCCICGSNNCWVQVGGVSTDTDGTTKFGSYSTARLIDGKPICQTCETQWHALSRKLGEGREATATEFIVWALGQVARKTEYGRWIVQNDKSDRSFVSVYGHMYDDIMRVLLAEAQDVELGNLQVHCHQCGWKVKVSDPSCK